MSHSENEISIEDVVDSFSMRLENGERPSIQEYKTRYPHLADRIEAVLPALVVLENVDSDAGERKLAVDDSIPQVLGEYQIIQEVGRGGMGIVFEAQHTTMRRRVALKVLPKSSAEKPNYLKRFLTEARSAGQLHHTNIVPVFEVGESAGLHYYSMQFIHGDNLDNVIDDIRKLRRESRDDGTLQIQRVKSQYSSRRNSSVSEGIARELVSGDSQNGSAAPSGTTTLPMLTGPSKLANTPEDETNDTVSTNHRMGTSQRIRNQFHGRVATVGVQIAEALAYAHAHGILHRDVKPANLILDTDGNVWITDFGLAKLDRQDLTQTGDIIGTLRYMAPERFAGDADPRSDIYSLGLTLYELATLKCAFENDRGTLVQDVANSSSVISPRKIDETIPSDLETIILKSIEARPDRRYQSAVELAEDLKLFLADRPIRARRATWPEKLWRICRRNPLASSLATMLAVLLIVVAAGSIQLARNEVSNRKASQRDLFFSKLDQAEMRRYSGRPGQRFKAMKAIRDAISLLPEMEFSDEKTRQTKFKLRTEVAAAQTLTDIERKWRFDFEPGWGNRKRFAIDLAGKYFAEGHDEGRIRIRNIADNEIFLELPGGRGTDPPWMMHFCPNSRYLIAKYHQPNVHDEFLTIVWDIENEGKQCFVTKHTREFDFSSDSKWIVISYPDRVDVVDLEMGEVDKTVFPKFLSEETPMETCFNSDASAIAVSRRGSGVVEFWDVVDSPALIGQIECDESVFCIAWDSERQIFVAGCHRGLLQYWIGDLSTAGEKFQLHQNTIYEMHLHPERELVATSAWDGTTRFADLIASGEVLSVESHKLLYNGFCSNGQIRMADEEDQIGVWQVASPIIQTFSSAEEKTGGFTCCIHPRYKMIVGRTVAERIEFWDIDGRKRLLTLNDKKSKAIGFSNSGDHFFASGDHGLIRWATEYDGQTLELKDPITLIDGQTGHFEIFADDRRMLVAVGHKIFEASSSIPESREEIGVHQELSRLRLLGNDRYALSGTWHGKGVKIWDLKLQECIQTVVPEINSSFPVPHPTDPNRFYSSRNHPAEFVVKKKPANGIHAQMTKRFAYEGLVIPLHEQEKMLIQTNSFNMIMLESQTQHDFAKLVSAGQSRIIDHVLSDDGNLLILACFDGLQVLDLAQFQKELQILGLDK